MFCRNTALRKVQGLSEKFKNVAVKIWLRSTRMPQLIFSLEQRECRGQCLVQFHEDAAVYVQRSSTRMLRIMFSAVPRGCCGLCSAQFHEDAVVSV